MHPGKLRGVVEQSSLFSDLPEKLKGKPVAPTRPQDARVVRPTRNQFNS